MRLERVSEVTKKRGGSTKRRRHAGMRHEAEGVKEEAEKGSGGMGECPLTHQRRWVN